MRSRPHPRPEPQTPPPATGRTKFYMIAGVDSTGQRFVEHARRPEHQLGDRKYFPDGLPDRRWVLRPVTLHDLPEGVVFEPGQSLLVRQIQHIGRFYNFVRLDRKFRRNTVANANLAYRQLCQARPEIHDFMQEMEALSDQIAAEQAAPSAA